jgi:hypothetical protein
MTSRQPSRAEVEAAYRSRLAERSRATERLRARVARLSYGRLGTFFLIVVAAWFAWETDLLPIWAVAIPAVVFGSLVVWHGRENDSLKRSQLAERFYERGIERLEERWEGRGRSGEAFARDDHPYARDLDIFGAGSLFERMATTVSPWGHAALADWLTTPAPEDIVTARQQAVRELSPMLDLREVIATENKDLEDTLEPEALATWATRPVELESLWVPGAALVLGLCNVALALSWLLSWTGREPLFVALVLSGALAGIYRQRVQAVLSRVEAPSRYLVVLSALLVRFERASPDFSSPRLVRLSNELSRTGDTASACIRRLSLLIDLLDARRNQLFIPFAALLLWGTQFAFALERFRGRVGPEVPRWLAAIGELDALLALAGYAYERPEDTFPEVDAARLVFEAEKLGHPLIAESKLVRNDVSFGEDRRLLIVSGSNMSGKSTLLRAVGVNTVLAFAGAPVSAGRLVLSPFAVGASIRIQDSLQDGISHFYAEILRLRQIMELASGDRPLLFLLDEILHGTNSHDRRIGAEAVVRGLVARGAVGLVTTHDLALAKLADSMDGAASNVHFVDEIHDGKVRFDYRLREGVVKKSNALELMRSIGLEV